MLGKLAGAVIQRFGNVAPDDSSKRRGDEARQLAWRLWTVRPAYAWLIAPGERPAFACQFSPLRLVRTSALPSAADMDLDHAPPGLLPPPFLNAK